MAEQQERVCEVEKERMDSEVHGGGNREGIIDGKRERRRENNSTREVQGGGSNGFCYVPV